MPSASCSNWLLQCLCRLRQQKPLQAFKPFKLPETTIDAGVRILGCGLIDRSVLSFAQEIGGLSNPHILPEMALVETNTFVLTFQTSVHKPMGLTLRIPLANVQLLGGVILENAGDLNFAVWLKENDNFLFLGQSTPGTTLPWPSWELNISSNSAWLSGSKGPYSGLTSPTRSRSHKPYRNHPHQPYHQPPPINPTANPPTNPQTPFPVPNDVSALLTDFQSLHIAEAPPTTIPELATGIDRFLASCSDEHLALVKTALKELGAPKVTNVTTRCLLIIMGLLLHWGPWCEKDADISKKEKKVLMTQFCIEITRIGQEKFGLTPNFLKKGFLDPFTAEVTDTRLSLISHQLGTIMDSSSPMGTGLTSGNLAAVFGGLPEVLKTLEDYKK
ncbi:hypothetical protein DEU56DRAFT_762015 [Suillus clintonianus]|uniref:uncharacterized protein n=1 Tax=Suillus clintonianus TaxID=1904413 RepID=UPI001B85CD59|nr:uncharacterized protein DEU56DRAFT_762015 [Suillus clintonianus]KAG2112771.1 hypothetical protein DEU56DRAFT_762015 [Suillus clintonianus]